MKRMNSRDWLPVGLLLVFASFSAAEAADEEIQAIYERSCKSCHSTPASGAPQTGDSEAWAPRVAKGVDTLLDNTIDGYKAMPPMGMCMDCSEEQFVALIEYMSGSDLE